MVFAFASCLPTLLFISLSIFSIHGLGKCHVDDQTGLLDFKSGITQDPSGLLTSWKAGTDCCTWAGVSCRDGVRVNSVTVKGKQNDQRSYLSGTISSSLSKLRYLDGIYLQNLRNIAGTFPTSLYNLPNLLYVYIENNKLSGPIPADIGIRLYKLDALSLYGNRFSGPIPNSVSKLTGLTHLNLGGNALTGPILDGIRNLKNLTYLNFEKNHLSGKIPDFFSSFLNLHVLSLSHNKFKLGEIPTWVISSPIYSLKLAGCGLKFSLRDFQPSQPYSYDIIDLSDNQISGSPYQLLDLTAFLKEFQVSGNQLQFNMSGLVIPQSLTYLNLSRNQMFGEVPKSISGLEKIDLSHNHLCGPIPTTKFLAEAFQGNDCLCGSPLPPCKK